jgi:hypothetical protein
LYWGAMKVSRRIFMLGVSILPLTTIFLLDFGKCSDSVVVFFGFFFVLVQHRLNLTLNHIVNMSVTSIVAFKYHSTKMTTMISLFAILLRITKIKDWSKLSVLLTKIICHYDRKISYVQFAHTFSTLYV